MTSDQYDEEKVVNGFCSNNKDEFLNTLKTYIEDKSFEAGYENVNSKVIEKCNGESLLHRVLKYKDPVNLKFVKKFAGGQPERLMEKRKLKSGVSNFLGQSPLHVAIVNGYADAVEAILKIAAKNNITRELLCIRATGKKFKRAVLMGQLPLSAAALACRNEEFEILDILFKNDVIYTIAN